MESFPYHRPENIQFNGVHLELLPEPSQKLGKRFSVKTEADKTDVPEDELLDALLRATLCCGN